MCTHVYLCMLSVCACVCTRAGPHLGRARSQDSGCPPPVFRSCLCCVTHPPFRRRSSPWGSPCDSAPAGGWEVTEEEPGTGQRRGQEAVAVKVLPPERSRRPAATGRGGSAVTRVYGVRAQRRVGPRVGTVFSPRGGSRAMRASGSWEVGVPRGPGRDLRGGGGGGPRGGECAGMRGVPGVRCTWGAQGPPSPGGRWAPDDSGSRGSQTRGRVEAPQDPVHVPRTPPQAQ